MFCEIVVNIVKGKNHKKIEKNKQTNKLYIYTLLPKSNIYHCLFLPKSNVRECAPPKLINKGHILNLLRMQKGGKMQK